MCVVAAGRASGAVFAELESGFGFRESVNVETVSIKVDRKIVRRANKKRSPVAEVSANFQ